MRKEYWAVGLAALALLILAVGWDREEPATRVDLSRRVDITLKTQTEAITYAYLPQYSHSISFERHRLLVEYLSRVTGYPFRQVFPDTFDEHVKMVERGEIDISFSNPFIYIRLARAGARAFARIVEESGRPDFYSQIICRKDNRAIHTLEDCRGKRWIAVDPSSAGGFVFALDYFQSHGIKRGDFTEIAFAPGPGGKQEKVVLAVYAGKYDIGSVRNGTLELVKNKVDLDAIRVLAESRPYPGWVYAVRRGFDPNKLEAIREAMLRLDAGGPEAAAILEAAHFKGIIPATDADYDPIRSLAGRISQE
ncbi:phosphate/phosphite/phosphonate ABC transporter substrate-binding protein [Desulfovibrio aminophilus]|nr:phosphate/phosphite/phosphonate ABC transporter substrate-binding protein [Desulfovibrio aminophilus]MCM0753766.1 phosphate/phosphite/phosphonate ABC transporter substrate-binding protein [Desulfovibrio aminophilus]